MRRGVLLTLAVAIVLVANAFVLIHAARNRVGTPVSDLSLTQRELVYSANRDEDENSGLNLRLQWTDPAQLQPWTPDGSWGTWLNRDILMRLGFPCAQNPDSPDAQRYYQRLRSRVVFIALEYDGPESRRYQQELEEAHARGIARYAPDFGTSRSRLVPVDADRDANALHARHPDQKNVLILPAVVGIMFIPRREATKAFPARGASVHGYIREIPSTIHVPRPFSDVLRRMQEDKRARPVEYRVHVRWGSELEPYITELARGPE